MAAHLKSFDFILNTVAARITSMPSPLLKRDGTMTLVGAPPRRIPRRKCLT